MKTYIIQETEKLIRYTTVQANSKAEALRIAEDGDQTMCEFDDNRIGGGVTYKVTKTGLEYCPDWSRGGTA
tara:strand:- start:483 stop:695 length:213 start_codon:yes stop_codon:yes gene_type:complete